jgi:hypothetical protein
MCVNYSKYTPEKKKQFGIKKNLNKTSNRMGSKAEMINHESNKATIDASMTPNSGAGKVKGDEQMRGLVNIMQEVKTQEVVRAKGHTQFTIKREWLDKLANEAPLENMDFWYLVFSFKDTDSQQYVVIDKQQMNDMVATLIDDRKTAKTANSKIALADKKRIAAETENLALLAKIDALEAEIELLKREREDK